MVSKIDDHFIPVALNLYTIRKQKDESGELFRSIVAQRDQYQGIWIISYDAKVVGGLQNPKNEAKWTTELLDVLDASRTKGLEMRERVKVPDPWALRGKGSAKDGSSRFAVVTRYLVNGKSDGPIVFDELGLSRDEQASLVPKDAKKGQKVSFPAEVTKRLARGLSPISDQSVMPAPGDVTNAELSGVVESVEGGTATISLKGSIAAKHLIEKDAKRPSYGEARIGGIVTADDKGLVFVLIVLDGTFKHAPPNDEARSTGAVFEWRR